MRKTDRVHLRLAIVSRTQREAVSTASAAAAAQANCLLAEFHSLDGGLLPHVPHRPTNYLFPTTPKAFPLHFDGEQLIVGAPLFSLVLSFSIPFFGRRRRRKNTFDIDAAAIVSGASAFVTAWVRDRENARAREQKGELQECARHMTSE